MQNEASSLARNVMSRATSSGAPTRRSGFTPVPLGDGAGQGSSGEERNRPRVSSSGVRIEPGAMQLQRMFSRGVIDRQRPE